jgi:hypothetical protein
MLGEKLSDGPLYVEFVDKTEPGWITFAAKHILERVPNIGDLDSRALLSPDFQAFARTAGAQRGILETCSSSGVRRAPKYS